MTSLQEVSKTSAKNMKTCLTDLQALYLDAMKAYNLQDPDLAHKVANMRPEFATSLSVLTQKASQRADIESLKALGSMTNLVGNLTRLTFDRE